jgi:hypothetical protein
MQKYTRRKKKRNPKKSVTVVVTCMFQPKNHLKDRIPDPRFQKRLIEQNSYPGDMQT